MVSIYPDTCTVDLIGAHVLFAFVFGLFFVKLVFLFLVSFHSDCVLYS